MSKGSRQRPSLVPQSQVDANWDAIFGKKKKVQDVTEVYNEERLVSKLDKEALAKENSNASKSE